MLVQRAAETLTQPERRRDQVDGRELRVGVAGEAERFFIRADDLRPIGRGRGWGVYSFESDARAVLTDSLMAIWPRKKCACGYALLRAGSFPNVASAASY